MILEYLDYTTTTFANGFAGWSPLIDGFMVQVCFTYILSTVPLTGLVVYLWDKNASDERRIRLLACAAAIGLSGLVCRIFAADLRSPANAIPHPASDIGTGELNRRSEKEAENLGYPVSSQSRHAYP
jgi:hypothetical protein